MRELTLDSAGAIVGRVVQGPAGELLFDQAFDHLGQEDLLLPVGDHQNSTRAVLSHDAAGATYVRQSIDYAQFGQVTGVYDENGAPVVDGYGDPSLSAIVTAHLHHGSLLDVATGLQQKGRRWYSPDTGRFLSEDPLGYAGGDANLYRFAGNNPVNFADPTGTTQAGHPLSRQTNDLLRNSVYTALRQPAAVPTTTFGGFVGAGLSNPILGNGGLSVPPPTVNSFYNFKGPVRGTQAAPPADRGIVTLPLARPVHGPVRQITPNAPIAPRDRQDLPGVRAALENPDRHIVANHSNQGYIIIAPDGRGRFVTGPDYLPLEERMRRNEYESRSAAGRAAALDLVGEGLIMFSPLHEGYRDAKIASRGQDFYNPHRVQSGQDQVNAGIMFFFPGGNSGQLGRVDDALDAVRPIHKNSLDYVGDTHVYRIIGPDGATYKIGESAQGVRVRDGASIRGEQQARQLRKETGQFYRSEIINNTPGKRPAREYETRMIDTFRTLYGPEALPGNRTNR